VRGEREGRRKRKDDGGEHFFERMEGEEKGRYAQTGGEEGDIWTDFSAEDQVYWRWPTGRRPDGASRDEGGSRRGGWLKRDRGCICKSKQASFPNTPRVNVRSVLLVVGFCNDGRCHVACDTVTANVTRRNRMLSPVVRPGKRQGYIHTHTQYIPLYCQQNGHIHRRGICDYMYQTPPRVNVPAFVRFVCVPIYCPDPDPRFEISSSLDYPPPCHLPPSPPIHCPLSRESAHSFDRSTHLQFQTNPS